MKLSFAVTVSTELKEVTKLLKELNKSESIGPIILGLEKPVHVFQLGASVEEMVNMAAVAVVDAQENSKKQL